MNSIIEKSKYCYEMMKKNLRKEFVMTKEDN